MSRSLWRNGSVMRLRSLIIPVVACGLIGYLGHQLLVGNHGIDARSDRVRSIASLEGELAGLQEVRGRIERDASLLRSDSLDPDMLDERARSILNLARPDDLVVLSRPSGAGGE